jgi:hypothetical protein
MMDGDGINTECMAVSGVRPCACSQLAKKQPMVGQNSKDIIGLQKWA